MCSYATLILDECVCVCVCVSVCECVCVNVNVLKLMIDLYLNRSARRHGYIEKTAEYESLIQGNIKQIK